MVKQFKKKQSFSKKEDTTQLRGLFKEVNKFTHASLNPYQRKISDLSSKKG